jgi:hypothetical protein
MEEQFIDFPVRAEMELHPEALRLVDDEEVVSEQPAPDDRLDQRQQAVAALAAIAELPPALREPATLFFVHECSHQDIAVFLGIPAATVNNRLHAARSRLNERMLTMVAETFQAHRLLDDFANRIGRLVETRGGVVEALFDPQFLPDLLTELAVSDEASKRAVTIQVIRRPGGGIVRGITVAPIDAVPGRGEKLALARPKAIISASAMSPPARCGMARQLHPHPRKEVPTIGTAASCQ